MEKTTTQPMLISIRESLQEAFANNWARCKSGLSNLIDQYNLMGLPKIATIDEVDLMLHDPEKFIYLQQTGGGAIIRGAHGNHLEVKTDVASQLFTKPKGYVELIQAIDYFKQASAKGYSHNGVTAHVRFNVDSTKKCFAIKEGELEFSDELQEQINTYGAVYATTEKGQAIVRFLEKMNKALFEEHLDQYLLGASATEFKVDGIYDLLSHTINGFDIESKKVKYLVDGGNQHAFKGDRYKGDTITQRR